MGYPIIQQLLPSPSYRRSGKLIEEVKFFVAHDTGNFGSTAQNNADYYTRTAYDVKASAHIFVDDKQIIELIPIFVYPEKAWHVVYSTPIDNNLYGVDANDCAIGVEYCFGDNINANEAYARYVWIFAHLCYSYKKSPKLHITAHSILDPNNRTDPGNGLAYSGRTYAQFLEDVLIEYNNIVKENSTVSGIFKDVPDEHYAKKAIEWFAQQGIIHGDGSGKFYPDSPISRADNIFVLYTSLVKEGIIKEG